MLLHLFLSLKPHVYSILNQYSMKYNWNYNNGSNYINHLLTKYLVKSKFLLLCKELLLNHEYVWKKNNNKGIGHLFVRVFELISSPKAVLRSHRKRLSFKQRSRWLLVTWNTLVWLCNPPTKDLFDKQWHIRIKLQHYLISLSVFFYHLNP